LSETHIAKRFWQRTSLEYLYTMTFSLLTDDDFEEESTLLVLDSPANPTLLRENVWRLVMSVTSGERSSEYWAKLGQDGSWEKTSEGSLASMMEESLEPFSGTWPAWGIASGGDAMELTKPQELHNAGTESLLSDTWRTPSAGDPKGGVMEMREGTSGKYKLRDHAANWKTPTANKLTGGTRKDFSEALIEQVANWSTPVANDETGSQYCYSGNGIALKLPGAAIHWSTPQAFDAKDVPNGNAEARRAAGGCRNLSQEAPNCPTPVANDDNKTFKAHMAMKARMKGGPRTVATSLQVVVQVWHSSPQAQENSTDGQESSMPDQTSRPPSRPTKRLNYKFSLWLMGFPEDWL
jgi:hypothetical protein